MFLRLFVLVLVHVLTLAMSAGVATYAQTPAPSGNESSLIFSVSWKTATSASLRAEDLQLAVDGQKIPILSLQKLHQPLNVAILIDNSASQTQTFAGQKLAADMFLRSVLRSSADKAAIVSFAHDATIEQDLTANIDQLLKALGRISLSVPAGYHSAILVSDPRVLGLPRGSKDSFGSTALWDAIVATANDMFAPAASGPTRAMILLSDGVDTYSRNNLKDAVNSAAKAGVTIYAIGIGSSNTGLAKDDLTKLSTRTGGRSFFPKKVGELNTIFSEIEQLLGAHYKITYLRPRLEIQKKVSLEFVSSELRKQGWRIHIPLDGKQ